MSNNIENMDLMMEKIKEDSSNKYFNFRNRVILGPLKRIGVRNRKLKSLV